MKAEIIAVGTELLLGQVVNTNATFISEELASLGFEIYYQTVVGDNPQRLEKLLDLADGRSELIILCGGLGPTDDDLTRDVVATHVGESLETDKQAMTKISRYMTKIGREMTENNRRQALTISGGRVVKNPRGLAIGTFYQGDETAYLLLPGPPSELIPMFHEEVVPLLTQLLPQKEVLTSRVLRFYGIGESRLVTVLKDLIDTQSNPTIAPYAKENEVTLRLTAKTDDKCLADKLLSTMEETIMSRVGTFFYGYGETNSLMAETVKLLKETNKTVTSAESLTAGLFQSLLGDVAGASVVYPGGVVTYATKVKSQLLGIPLDKLEENGVISQFCAENMAKQIGKQLETDYAVSFTGVAGPDSLEDQEPGTVWLGIYSRKEGTRAEKFMFNGNRNQVRHHAVMRGTDLLRRQILKETEK